MSASDFDPSLLEGKDRSELVAIATSLGQKPPARAKKADVITLIMQLVGADQPGDAASGADRDGPAEPEIAAAGETVEPGADVADQPAPEVHAEEPAEGARDDATAASTDEAAAPEASSGRRGGGRGQNGGQAQPDQGAKPANPSNQGPQGGQGGGGNQGNQGGGQDAAAGPGNEAPVAEGGEPNGNQAPPTPAPAEDGESTNRRRRRRGRDRDRAREGEETNQQAEPLEVEGMVDLREEGYGFLRLKGFSSSRDDAYISVKQARQFALRTGDIVRGKARPANRNERNPALLQVERVNGHSAHQQPARRSFAELTPLFPNERLRLELADDPTNTTVRIIDLVAPIGKGTRGLIVAPPKAGETMILKHIVRSIEVNHPEVEVFVLLVDERPEEVTDMQRWLVRGEVAASTFDRPAEEHTAVAELVIERAKRLVEDGKDVVVILDGLTRLTRAYNLAAPATGHEMAGGIDTGALYPPKKIFGAARKAEEGGSLTILATVLVETGTRTDEVVFEAFQGTGNMELRLDRSLAERRIYPAIDVDASSTRHEELLFDRTQLEQIWKLRRDLGGLRSDAGSSAPGLEMLTERLAASRTNDDFLAGISTS